MKDRNEIIRIGTVISLLESKVSGILRDENKQEIDFITDMDDFSIGQIVRFEIVKSKSGLVAINLNAI